MTAEVIALDASEPSRQTIGEKLHSWVVTVDHKRLGILYILCGLLFLVVAVWRRPSFGSSSSFRTAISFRPRFSTACSRCMAQR